MAGGATETYRLGDRIRCVPWKDLTASGYRKDWNGVGKNREEGKTGWSIVRP